MFAMHSLSLASVDISADKDFPAFAAFIDNHRAGVGYGSEVETMGRFAIFKENLGLIAERNTKCAGKCKHGITKFADLSVDEFRSKYTGLKPASKELKEKVPYKLHSGANATVKAASIDWRLKGAVTPIKNQVSLQSWNAHALTRVDLRRECPWTPHQS